MSQDIAKEIVTLVSLGRGIKQIADVTKYSEDSIVRILWKIRKEHGARNSAHLVRIWFEKGLFGKE